MSFQHMYMWDNPMESCTIFVAVMIILLSTYYYSFISVASYTVLFLLGTTSGIKFYMYLMKKIFKEISRNPFQQCNGELFKKEENSVYIISRIKH